MKENFLETTSAVYRVLNFLPESDPLKNKAKNKALEILENLTLVFNYNGWVLLGDYLSQEALESAKKAKENISILESYLELAKLQGWISDINFLIIKKEYGEIKKELNEKIERLKPKLESIEAVSRAPEIKKAQSSALLNEIEGKDILTDLPKIKLKMENDRTEDLKVPYLIKETENGYTTRQVKILKIMALRPKTQVADIIKELPDVTKRTIRRDLDDLLKRGRVLRMGEFNQIFYVLNDRT